MPNNRCTVNCHESLYLADLLVFLWIYRLREKLRVATRETLIILAIALVRWLNKCLQSGQFFEQLWRRQVG
jgi:hypothetical protein